MNHKARKILSILLVFCLTALPVFSMGNPVFAAEQEQEAYESRPYVPGEVIVVFEDGANEETAQVVADAMDATVVQELEPVNQERQANVVEIPPDQSVEEAIAQFETDPAVAYAQPVYIYTIDEEEIFAEEEEAEPDADAPTSDPYAGSQWHLNKIGTFSAWDALATLSSRSKVRVAVIDTPVQLTHPDLQANVNKNMARDLQTGMESSNYPEAVNVHGTHVTGIIGATANNNIGVAGVASGYNNNMVEIVPVNVFSASSNYESASNTSITAGIRWAVNNGARVINMSLGYHVNSMDQRDYYLEQAVNDAYAANVLVVGSAGNSGGTTLHYPSDFTNAMSVINLVNADYADRSINPRNSASSYGSQKDISAPGTNIVSTAPTFTSSGSYGAGYRSTSGTSMSSPVVTSVAAMLLYADPSLSAGQLWNLLINTAYDVYITGFDVQTGWGCVQAGKAVQQVTGISPNPNPSQTGGWRQESGAWYYYINGQKLTNRWYQTGGAWYYFTASGKMHTGWLQYNGSWYYMLSSGKMHTGWVNTGNHWYYMLDSGKMHTGWLGYGGYFYYFAGSGKMHIGWLQHGNDWYYTGADGKMVTGVVTINGKNEWFADNGVWLATV